METLVYCNRLLNTQMNTYEYIHFTNVTVL